MKIQVRSSQNGVSHSPTQAHVKQTMTIMPMPSSGLVPGPTTNLNIGMDYWANTASSSPAMHGNAAPTAVPGAVVPPEPWIQVSSWTLSCNCTLIFCCFNLVPSQSLFPLCVCVCARFCFIGVYHLIKDIAIARRRIKVLPCGGSYSYDSTRGQPIGPIWSLPISL